MRRAKGSNRQKFNNKGMSLVEVLVAMLVLALVSFTFLESFSYAMKINQRAKVNQHALTLATSLMESTKAYGKRSLDEQFSGAIPFRVYDVGTGSFSIDGGDYVLQNIDFNGYKYDARITMTASTDASGATFEANLITIENNNKFNDAFFVQQLYEQQCVLDAAEAHMLTQPAISFSASCVKINSRVLTVTIESNDTVSVKANYTYEIIDHPVDNDGDGLAEATYSTNGLTAEYDYSEIYKNTNTRGQGARLENLFFYYYPAYNNAYNTFLECDSDNIVINNASPNLANIYIMKQKNAALADTGMANGEDDYDMNVDYNGSNLNIYHNLDEQLVGSGHPEGFISGGTNMGTPWTEDATPTVLLYDVKIQIMKAGETEVICELEGTANTK